MLIRGIAFDLEGTVVDVEAAHHAAHLASAKEVGIDLSYEEALVRLPRFIGGPDVHVDIWNLLNAEQQKSISSDYIRQRTEHYYRENLAGTAISARPGFFGFLKTVRGLNVSVSIGSLTPEQEAGRLLEGSGLLDHFGRDSIILREHVKRLKPAPDVFLKTASIMGIDPRQQLVFEDSPRGVQAAIAAGSKAVGMPVVIRGSTVGALVDAGACRVFFDWREINVPALIENLS